MVVALVNPRHDTGMQVDCALRGVAGRQGSAQILHDSDINADNSFDAPDRVTIKPLPVTVEAGRIVLALPAMSIVTVTLQAA